MLESNRTLLRRFIKDDLQALLKLTNNREVMKYTGFREVQSEAKTKELLDKWLLSKKVWAAIDKDTGDFVGWFMLKKTILDAPELGFMLAREYWSRGYATEVSKCLVDYCFYTLKENKMIASADKENLASFKVLKKLGFLETESYSEDKKTSYFELLKKT
jgi:ribosomal-protein-alanine N-acetyltransferase